MFVFIQNENNFVSWPKGPTIRLITLLITRLIRLITNNRTPFLGEKFPVYRIYGRVKKLECFTCSIVRPSIFMQIRIFVNKRKGIGHKWISYFI